MCRVCGRHSAFVIVRFQNAIDLQTGPCRETGCGDDSFQPSDRQRLPGMTLAIDGVDLSVGLHCFQMNEGASRLVNHKQKPYTALLECLVRTRSTCTRGRLAVAEHRCKLRRRTAELQYCVWIDRWWRRGREVWWMFGSSVLTRPLSRLHTAANFAVCRCHWCSVPSYAGSLLIPGECGNSNRGPLPSCVQHAAAAKAVPRRFILLSLLPWTAHFGTPV